MGGIDTFPKICTNMELNHNHDGMEGVSQENGHNMEVNGDNKFVGTKDQGFVASCAADGSVHLWDFTTYIYIFILIFSISF